MIFLAILLYALGWGMTYSTAPTFWPLTCKGRTGARFLTATGWPWLAVLLWQAIVLAKFG